MVGVLVGSQLFGLISDYFGRKLSILLGIATVTTAPTIAALMPTAAGFGLFRFLSGKNYLILSTMLHCSYNLC